MILNLEFEVLGSNIIFFQEIIQISPVFSGEFCSFADLSAGDFMKILQVFFFKSGACSHSSIASFFIEIDPS